jgi:Raf kinase inhibitor-like YbhB/YbcL family protein
MGGVTMKIKCSEFENNSIIPDRFSQNDANRSPPLDFVDVPAGAKSLVLIMDDPDAPRGTFTHWVLFNIDGNTNGFHENQVPKDVHHGLNDYKQPTYAGPKPPDGEHRYFFHLYALGKRLSLPEGASRRDVEGAMAGHVIAEAELMGRYATPVTAR